MVTKKVRTEYMKKFREPKWETFSKCYEDSLHYRLTRRVMEHSHKPWFWEGGSVLSSGQSTPRTAGPRARCNRVAPLSVAAVTNQLISSPDARKPSNEEEEQEAEEEAVDADAVTPAEVAQTENAVSPSPNPSGASDELETANGSADSPDSNTDPPKATAVLTEQSCPRQGSCRGNKSPADRKPERAKSQPPLGGARDNQRSRCEDAPTSKVVTPNNGERCDASVQTPTTMLRPPDKRPASTDRRRARSADPDKLRRWQLTTSTSERWVTEYMRCFSARVR
ncbi:centriole, cilia and spindle-associated protein [Syngnathus scovelli]|uniref:centriole, cilia and spindle-associated protein n=1 Tax=Syngnathus scovelli TaxID=161590 RepID=UPI00210F303A|nr:centriole, cilia and spindle-associated protein [Syngnathus scovelli]